MINYSKMFIDNIVAAIKEYNVEVAKAYRDKELDISREASDQKKFIVSEEPTQTLSLRAPTKNYYKINKQHMSKKYKKLNKKSKTIRRKNRTKLKGLKGR